jgi:hypothetical protein
MINHRNLIIISLLLISFVLTMGCNDQGGLYNPMEGVTVGMNIPIVKAPNSYIDPNTAPASAPVVNTTMASGEFAVTPVPGKYAFTYE